MADAVPAELRAEVLAQVDDDEAVELARELIRIPSFTEVLCTRVLALTALEATR